MPQPAGKDYHHHVGRSALAERFGRRICNRAGGKHVIDQQQRGTPVKSVIAVA